MDVMTMIPTRMKDTCWDQNSTFEKNSREEAVVNYLVSHITALTSTCMPNQFTIIERLRVTGSENRRPLLSNGDSS